MLKIPRFIVEYANYQIKSISNNDLMNPGIKNELLRRIDYYVRSCQYGYITVDECMKLLSMPDSNEDMTQYMTA